MTDSLIWDVLYEDIQNLCGVAGIMGNLEAESGLNPEAISKKIPNYIQNLKNGSYTRDQFIYDGVAFGIAQWLYWSRKAALWDYAESQHLPVYSLQAQAEFLLKEIKTYKTVYNTLRTAGSVKEASDIVLTKYEKPANISDAVKEKRTKLGYKYLNLYGIIPAERGIFTNFSIVRTTVDNVLIRCGNGKEYSVISKIKAKGTAYPLVATAENGWHAIQLEKSVEWVSGEFTEVIRFDRD